MDDAIIEFLQFLSIIVALPYVLGIAVCMVMAPFVVAWFWLKDRLV